MNEKRLWGYRNILSLGIDSCSGVSKNPERPKSTLRCSIYDFLTSTSLVFSIGFIYCTTYDDLNPFWMAMFRFKRGQTHLTTGNENALLPSCFSRFAVLRLDRFLALKSVRRLCLVGVGQVFLDADAVDPCGFTARNSSSQAFFGGIVLRENFQIVWTKESRTDSTKPLISHLLCVFQTFDMSTCLGTQAMLELVFLYDPSGALESQDIYGLLWSNWMSKLLKLLSLRTKNRFYKSYRMVFLVWHWCRILGVWLCSHKKWSISHMHLPFQDQVHTKNGEIFQFTM